MSAFRCEFLEDRSNVLQICLSSGSDIESDSMQSLKNDLGNEWMSQETNAAAAKVSIPVKPLEP